MGVEATLGLRPDLYERLAATDPFAGRARKLFGRGQVVAARGNEADLRVGYDGRGNALELKQVPMVSGYVPQVGDWVAIGYEAGQSGAPWVMGPSMGPEASGDPSGIGVFPVGTSDPAGAAASTIYFDESRGVWRGYDGTQWVDFSDSGHISAHNSLSGLQGGMAGQYYHLTAAEYAGQWLHRLQVYEVNPIECFSGIRATAFANVTTVVLYQLQQTSGNMVDGFGVRQDFAIEDATSGPQTIAQIAAIRDGADNTGKFSWLVSAAGVMAERMGLTAAGALAITGAYSGTGATLTGLTQGSVIFAGAGGLVSQDNASLFFDPATHQLELAAGTAALPSLARKGFADDGIYWPGDGLFAVSLGGAERFRWSANDVGMVATGRIYLDGVTCGGDTYLYEVAGNQVALFAGGAEIWRTTGTGFGILCTPSYPLDVTGQGRVTTQFSVGTTPNAARTLNLYASQNAVGAYYGAFNYLENTAAAQQTGTLTGLTNTVRHNIAGQIADAFVGVDSSLRVIADNATLSLARGMLSSVTISAGTARAVSQWRAFELSTSIGAGGSIGTLYAFYMPTCSGTTRWGIYIADTGAPSYFAAPTEHASGTAAAPGIAWLAEADSGFYRAGTAAFAATIDGVERWRWSGNDVGMVAGGRHYWDGVGCGGDTYTYESAANALTDRVGGADIFTRYTDRIWVNAGDPVSPANGDLWRSATYNQWQAMAGGLAGTFDQTIQSSGTPAAGDTITAKATETVFASAYLDLPTTKLMVGNRYLVRASGYAKVNTQDSPGSAGTYTIRVRCGGATGLTGVEIAQVQFSRNPTSGAQWCGWVVEAEFAIRATGAAGKLEAAVCPCHHTGWTDTDITGTVVDSSTGDVHMKLYDNYYAQDLSAAARLAVTGHMTTNVGADAYMQLRSCVIRQLR